MTMSDAVAVEPEDYDAIVIGLGAMGAATFYQLAKLGMRVLGIDRYVPPHAYGATHGNSRVTREAVAEGAAYVPLVRRSHQIVAELEHQLGESFMVRCGTLMIGSEGATGSLHNAADFVGTSIDIARQFGIEHVILTADDLRRRYPRLKTIRDGDRGYLEPNAGYLRPEALVAAQIREGQRLGGHVSMGTMVGAIHQENDGVRVETADGCHRAKRVVVTAGAWTRDLLGDPYKQLLTVTRQVVHWFDVDDAASLSADNMPVFMWFVSDRPEDYFTGFPVDNPSEGLKIITSDDGPDVNPDALTAASIEESRRFGARCVVPNIEGVDADSGRSATCFYTNTCDHGFIIDEHPAMDRVSVVCACSGHGFKHSLAIGEAVAQHVVHGHSAIDLSAFSLSRFEDVV